MALAPVSWVDVSQRLAISNQSWELAGGRVFVCRWVGMRGGEGKKMGDLCYGTREAVAWSPPTPRWLSDWHCPLRRITWGLKVTEQT